MMKLTALLCLVGINSVVSKETTMTWIWGKGKPTRNPMFKEEGKLLSDFTDHGFIQLQYSDILGAISIKLVKRPPNEFYPESNKFCSKMLPATIADFIDIHHIPRIEAINVTLDAHPYMAACKCYMRTMISMGLNRVGLGEGVVVTSDQVEDFCAWRPTSITGRPAVERSLGHSPATVSLEDMDQLRSTVSSIL